MTVAVRLLHERDAPAQDRALRASLHELRPWMAFVADEPKTLQERRRWIAEGSDDAANRRFGIFVDGELAGGWRLHDRVGPGGLEIGYWVATAFHRRGVATAAVRALCAIAFADAGIERVEIHHDAANAASEGVARRARFTHVEDRPDPPQAPADSGIERVWHLRRKDLGGSGSS